MEQLRAIATWTWWIGLVLSATSFGLALGPLIGSGVFWAGVAVYGLVALCVS